MPSTVGVFEFEEEHLSDVPHGSNGLEGLVTSLHPDLDPFKSETLAKLNYIDVTEKLAEKCNVLNIHDQNHQLEEADLDRSRLRRNRLKLDINIDNHSVYSSGCSTPRPVSREDTSPPDYDNDSTRSRKPRSTTNHDEYEVQINQEYVSSQAPTSSKRIPTKTMTPQDFEPLKILGRGAYAKVYLVRQKETGLLFAMKVLQKASIIVRKKTIEHTKTERTILEDVYHPFIVKLYYAFQTNHRLYLILEYAPGGELFTHLATERMFSEKVASFYAAELILALEHIHSLGIIYRDLKPENCLLDIEGHIVITDFGLSKVGVRTGSGSGIDSPSTNTWCGTPEYMAPEIVQEKSYDSAVDWWSLGCMIQDMLTGSPPFTGPNRKKVMDAICSKKPTFPFYLSAEAKDLLTKLLRKDPKNRLGSTTYAIGQASREQSRNGRRTRGGMSQSRSRSSSPALGNPATAIKLHPFFRHIDWKALEKKELIPPIIPCVTDLELAENFDFEFTSIPFVKDAVVGNMVDDEDIKRTSKAEIDNIVNNLENVMVPEIASGLFTGFSYQASPTFIQTTMGQ